MKHSVILIAIIALFSAKSYADTIYLKDGTLLKARVVSEDENSIVIETDAVWKKIPRNSFREIKRDEEAYNNTEKSVLKPITGKNPIGKESVKISGSLGYANTNSKYSGRNNGSASTISIAPEVEFFIGSGFSFGPEIGILMLNNPSQTNTELSYGVSIAKYFGSEKSKVFPYIGYSFLSTHLLDAYKTVATGNLLMPKAGIDIMISEKTSIGIYLYYSTHSYQYSGDYSYTYGFGTYVDSTYGFNVTVAAFCY